MDDSISEKLYLRRIHENNLSLTHPHVVGRDLLSIKADGIRRLMKSTNRK